MSEALIPAGLILLSVSFLIHLYDDWKHSKNEDVSDNTYLRKIENQLHLLNTKVADVVQNTAAVYRYARKLAERLEKENADVEE